MCGDEGIKTAHVGTAAPGCTAGRSPAALAAVTNSPGSKDIHKRLLPYPRILSPFRCQPKTNRVFEDIDYLRVEVLRRAQYMIKRFGLPNSSLPSQRSIDLVGRSSFDSVHDLSERINLHSLPVDQRSEDHMNMVRHHDSDAQIELFFVVMPTAF